MRFLLPLRLLPFYLKVNYDNQLMDNPFQSRTYTGTLHERSGAALKGVIDWISLMGGDEQFSQNEVPNEAPI